MSKKNDYDQNTGNPLLNWLQNQPSHVNVHLRTAAPPLFTHRRVHETPADATARYRQHSNVNMPANESNIHCTEEDWSVSRPNDDDQIHDIPYNSGSININSGGDVVKNLRPAALSKFNHRWDHNTPPNTTATGQTTHNVTIAEPDSDQHLKIETWR